MATALVVIGIWFALGGAMGRAASAVPGDEQGVQVLTRGPVHEAFTGVITFNSERGVMAPKTPPATIEELPPDERPEGDNVTWIPGYWAWDDERNDFLWVSGVWRALPPGRQWVAGYWGKTGQGFQWTAGYWADATVSETTYLPPPPATVEAGPNIAAPSPDYDWTPGCWVWYESRYAWRPGYWIAGRSDWDWCPAYYVWTPRGYVFVDGYWDYSIGRRGVLFAPVYFKSGVYARRGYRYSPRIVIDLGVFSDHLFLRPRYHHYYFGDYYAASYVSGGFYASFSFQSGRYGYDPIFAHQRWVHRQDREWEHRVQTTYVYRRDHEDARPPRTWAAQQNIKINVNVNVQSQDRSRVVATPLDQLSKRKDGPVRFQPVAKAEKQQLVQREQEVRKSRDERRTLETSTVVAPSTKPGRQSEPARVKLPKSPIVAKSVDQLGKDQAPPKPHQVPQLDSKAGIKPEASTPEPKADKDNRQLESPKPEAKPETVQPPKREVRPQVERPVKREVPPAVEQPAKRDVKPETVQPARREAKPEVERPGKREVPPAVEQPAKRDVQPETVQPPKREVRPQVERPVKREAPPVVEQPAKREVRPETVRSAREKPAESDQGGTNTANNARDKKGR
jgi:hypothetical protein